MKRIFKKAFLDTVPVLTGYLALGFGFGILLKSGGYSVLLAFVMSLTIYAGSMQYVAIGLLSGGASLITTAVTTFMVNARHIFYGISMLDRYKSTGLRKIYLFFSLTDETYSLLCHDDPKMSEEDRPNYYLTVSLLNQSYWVIGCTLGAVVGSLVKFNTDGIDFVLTALFVTVFVEQWLSTKKHSPALIGVFSSVLCLVIFGADNFLIPSMLLIALLLCILKEERVDD